MAGVGPAGERAWTHHLAGIDTPPSQRRTPPLCGAPRVAFKAVRPRANF